MVPMKNLLVNICRGRDKEMKMKRNTFATFSFSDRIPANVQQRYKTARPWRHKCHYRDRCCTWLGPETPGDLICDEHYILELGYIALYCCLFSYCMFCNMNPTSLHSALFHFISLTSLSVFPHNKLKNNINASLAQIVFINVHF